MGSFDNDWELISSAVASLNPAPRAVSTSIESCSIKMLMWVLRDLSKYIQKDENKGMRRVSLIRTEYRINYIVVSNSFMTLILIFEWFSEILVIFWSTS